MTKSVTETLVRLDGELRRRYNLLGFVNGKNCAYQTGHVPHVAPFAYLCTRYAKLDDDGVRDAENEAERYIPEPYKEFLRHMNGARILGVSLHGGIGGSVDRSGVGIGQPISIRYQNAVERPHYIPNGHLGIGAINGEWFSQGHLYLASTGEVELYNAKFDMVGARWSSLSDFLENEIPRRFAIYDDEGREIEKSKRLPGDTEDWERLAREAKDAGASNGFLKRVLRKLHRE
ncbi:SMI1/KNR4 family protein [Celeribacter baekdonensis]|uniref:SMI1/KNR4 family protein n=1 Tax=Celeribacter baekdonensis TaxID=875171 RepID=UPI003A8EC505